MILANLSLLAATVLGDIVANPRVSFQFDDSSPFSEAKENHIYETILESMLVPRGDNYTVSFVPNGQFNHRNKNALAYQKDDKIVFNRDWMPVLTGEFTKLLEHEIGHALGLDHRRGKSFMNGGRRHPISDRDRERIIEALGIQAIGARTTPTRR